MVFMSETKIDEQIEEKTKELNALTSKKTEIETKRKRQEQGTKLFRKMFLLKRISDDCNVYPEECYLHIEMRFIREFHDDGKGGHDKHLIETLRQDYIDSIKTDVKMLQEELSFLEEQYKELKEGK